MPLAVAKFGGDPAIASVPFIATLSDVLGIVTHDDIVTVINQEATEDIQRQAAVGPIRESYLDAPLATVWYSRGKWLALLFVMQMVTINAMRHFEGELGALLILAAFIPVCLSVGGNAGSQAAALVTRAMALGQAHTSDWVRILRRELLVGVALGAMLGVLGLARTWMFTRSDDLGAASLVHLSYTIALSVAAICMAGTLIG